MKSARRRTLSLSSVTSPMIRIAKPGPGNGWRHTIASGNPSALPTSRTSSLNNERRGSIKVKSKSSGRPPTLWCDFMFAVPVPPPDSTTSGYNVPCTKNSTFFSAEIFAAASSKVRINSRPIILRFSSGSVTPFRAAKNFCRASTTMRFTPVAATKSRSTCSASPSRNNP